MHESHQQFVQLVGQAHGVGSVGRIARQLQQEAFRAQRECVYPKAVKDVWEEEWKKMMAELGGGAKIPDLDHVGVARSLS